MSKLEKIMSIHTQLLNVSIDISYAVGFIYFTFFIHWLWWFQFRNCWVPHWM